MKYLRTIPKLGARRETLIFVCPSCKGFDTKEMGPTNPSPPLNRAPPEVQNLQNPSREFSTKSGQDRNRDSGSVKAAGPGLPQKRAGKELVEPSALDIKEHRLR